jgi:hypothetical protein
VSVSRVVSLTGSDSPLEIEIWRKCVSAENEVRLDFSYFLPSCSSLSASIWRAFVRTVSSLIAYQQIGKFTVPRSYKFFSHKALLLENHKFSLLSTRRNIS